MRLFFLFLLALPVGATDYHMWIAYGQSLSTGFHGDPPISTTQPFSNVTIAGQNAGTFTGLTALIENKPPVGGLPQEGPNSEFANEITNLVGTYVSSINGYGGNGLTIAQLMNVGGCTTQVSLYCGIINGVTFMQGQLAGGDTLTVHAVIFTHGETDYWNGSTTYEANLVTLQSQIETGIKAVTGQSGHIPFLLTQMSAITVHSPKGMTCPDGSVGCINDTSANFQVNLAQFNAFYHHPERFTLVGPKYQYMYFTDGTPAENVHLFNTTYNDLGALYGYVAKRMFVDGFNWRPLHPLSITRSGATITVVCNVPEPPLVIDTTLLPVPLINGVQDSNGMGFQFFQTPQGGITITNVAVSGNTVTITLSGTPSGTSQRLAYAFEGTSNACQQVSGVAFTAANPCGSSSGAWQGMVHGNIRDSNTLVSYSNGVGWGGDAVYNWMVHFNLPVGFFWGTQAGGNVTAAGKTTVQ